MTAPAPVSTAQPNSAASRWLSSTLTFTQDRRDTTAYSAKQDTPVWWLMYSSPMCRRRSPPNRVPLVLAAAPGSHSAGRPSMQGLQQPQLGTNTMATWSPGFRSVTPGPASTTSPDDSCPSTIGTPRGRSPLMTDRSEWHSPAALIRTSTSPKPGGSSSISAMLNGRVRA
ncbi:hypothetical protein D9M68_833100 [compost metagenome]